MIKKTILYFFAFLLLATIVLFSIPVKTQSFSEYYQNNDDIQKSLLSFREYPTKTISYNNNEWDYISIGNGPKHLLFLHGMGGAYDIWFQQIEKLKDSFHIVSLTMPTVHSLSDATDGIIQILNKENIEKVSIIGSSMGGYIGQYFLKKHPDRLNKMVLGNTFPPNKFYQEENGKMRKIIPFLPEWFVMSEFRKNASKNVIPASENSKLVEAYLFEQYSGLMTKQQFIGRFDMVLEYFELSKTADSQSIPKLIIESDNDPLVNEDLRNELKSNYPEAEIFTFSGKGHFPYLNRPNNYNDILLKFLTD
ncbi:MAG: alpha/beta hydrolase [Flavobacteriaceae bacterium]